MAQEPSNNRGTLYGKIAAVAAAVSRIPKNGHNNFHNYSYATESDITDGLRELLNANGLAFLPPSVLSWERDEIADNPKIGPRTRVQVQFALGCADTGETYTTILWGEANDNADKGFYKAYTGAVKYYLMKTFLIATGDDPEQDHQGQQRDNRPASFAPPAERQQAPAQPQRQQAAPQPPAPTNGDVPICPVHNKPMRPGAKGGYFCATKVGKDDQGKDLWCKARPEKPAPAVRTPPDDWEAEYDAIEASR